MQDWWVKLGMLSLPAFFMKLLLFPGVCIGMRYEVTISLPFGLFEWLVGDLGSSDVSGLEAIATYV